MNREKWDGLNDQGDYAVEIFAVRTTILFRISKVCSGAIVKETSVGLPYASSFYRQ